jgi:hypothetical protein
MAFLLGPWFQTFELPLYLLRYVMSVLYRSGHNYISRY